MDKSDELPQTERDTKINIINAVKTPLGFFVLVVLIVEVVFGISASLSSGNDRTYLIVGMLALIFLMVLIVAGMALFRPSSLYGVSPTQTAQSKSFANEKVNFAPKIKNIDITELGKFFGRDIFTDNFKVVYGLYSRIPSDKPVDELPKVYEKVLSNKTVYQLRAPQFIITAASLRGISYFVQEFSKYRDNPFTICADDEAILSYHKNSFMTIGGPVTNELSDLALKEEGNKFLKFVIEREFKNLPQIQALLSGEKFERPKEKGKDYGIIVKVKNSQAPGKYIFVCAGIGAIGSSSAVWYLTNYWKQLYKKFGTKEFGIIVGTEREQDNMAKCLYSAGA